VVVVDITVVEQEAGLAVVEDLHMPTQPMFQVLYILKVFRMEPAPFHLLIKTHHNQPHFQRLKLHQQILALAQP
jgi:hypothetical protein